MKINPLTEEQIAILDKMEIDRATKPFRILANDHTVDLFTGLCCSKNYNGEGMYHPMYWDKSHAAIYQVLQFMRLNNPGVRFRVTYH